MTGQKPMENELLRLVLRYCRGEVDQASFWRALTDDLQVFDRAHRGNIWSNVAGAVVQHQDFPDSYPESRLKRDLLDLFKSSRHETGTDHGAEIFYVVIP